MRGQKLRIGRIPYGNLFPIFFVLENEVDCSCYEFVEGSPSRLNRMLREGQVDLSPSSSVEYLRAPGSYEIIDGHSISSTGAVGSIFLFSKRPIEQLSRTTIAVSSHSETSVALLEIIMKRFYEAECGLEVHDRPQDAGRPAYLLIGDEALRRLREHIEAVEGRHGDHVSGAVGRSLYVYDLGEIWHRRTGLPFVFALWIVRREISPPHAESEDPRTALLEKFVSDLDFAKQTALKKLSSLAHHSPLRAFMSEQEILSYWDRLDYDLGPEHRRGLDLFGDYLRGL